MSETTTVLCPNCGSTLRAVSKCDPREILSEVETQYDCSFCNYRYSYSQEYNPDALFIDIPLSNSLYCALCDKHFNQTSSLRRHMASHSNNRPYICDVCEKDFKTKAALKRHSIIHTGECPYECSTCKRRFNQISNLRKHSVTHNNNCPFYCDVCGKGFNQLSNLKKHLNVHQVLPPAEGSKPAHSVVPKGSEKIVSRPLLTFIKPAES